jgi:hypothetical protein
MATVLGSNPAALDTMESEGRQIKQCLLKVLKYKKYLSQPYGNWTKCCQLVPV